MLKSMTGKYPLILRKDRLILLIYSIKELLFLFMLHYALRELIKSEKAASKKVYIN